MSAEIIKVNHDAVLEQILEINLSIDLLREHLEQLNGYKSSLLNCYRGNAANSFTRFSEEEYDSFYLIIGELERLSGELKEHQEKFRSTDDQIAAAILKK